MNDESSQVLERYLLSSLDSARLEPVREFRVRRVVSFDTGKPALLGDLDPGVAGQDFGWGEDIHRVVLTARHEGAQIDDIKGLPCFVLIALPEPGMEELQTPIRADDLQVIGWGGCTEAPRTPKPMPSTERRRGGRLEASRSSAQGELLA